jgi:DNA-directed RNA polymerase specialized sigma24 family protein
MIPMERCKTSAAARPSDEELVKQVRDGRRDRAAAEVLLDRYRGPMRRFLTWRTQFERLRPDERDDVWQEAVLALLGV